MSPLKAAGYTPANGAAYPKGAVGDSLRDLARLIKARIGLRAATIDVGNWDMHSGLGSSDSGWMFRQAHRGSVRPSPRSTRTSAHR